MTARASPDPAEMPKLLPHVALVEVYQFNPRLPVRLISTNIANIYGKNFTGQYLNEIDFGGAGDKILLDCENEKLTLFRSYLPQAEPHQSKHQARHSSTF
jgi:hypothetical protein